MPALSSARKPTPCTSYSKERLRLSSMARSTAKVESYVSAKDRATHSPPEAVPENIAAAFNEGNAICSAAMTEKNPRRTGGLFQKITNSYFLRRSRLPPPNEMRNVNAFCRIAPSVRRIIRPILRAGVVFASDLSCRTSPVNQGTLFRRAAIIRPHMVCFQYGNTAIPSSLQ